mmetsp:Transcript_13929/g.50726  ORF Transcript_13929/g.50726 Transcript_13929/m.50726 type:complete len:140 (-) Transcript_13929:1448-1867(-)
MTLQEEQSRRHRELNGFVLWIASSVVYAAYLLWAYLPEAWLRQAGITYSPDRLWAIALPCLFCVFVAVLAGAVYPGFNLMSMPPLTSKSNFTDSKSNLCIGGTESAVAREIPDVHDVPITTVNGIMLEVHREQAPKVLG